MLEILRKRRDEEGFTLIELMVVVLIIAILIAIAIPTFLGARERAQNRAAQSNVRNAFTAEKTFYTDSQVYTDGVAALTAIEPSITFHTDAAPTVNGDVYASVSAGGVLTLGVKSASGTCYYLQDDPASGTKYATSGSCPAPSAATGFTTKW